MSRHNESIAKTVRLYRAIEAFDKKHKYSPTYKELIEMGFLTPFWHIQRLKKWGLIESRQRRYGFRIHPITAAPAEVQRYFTE